MNNFDIGDIYSQEGKYIEALQYYTKGKNILLSSPTPNNSTNRYGAIQTGIVFKKLGLYEQSRACYQEALTYQPNTSSPTSILRGIKMLINIAPDLNEVRKLVSNGQTIVDTLHLPIPALNFYTAAGIAFMDSLQYDQAEYYFNKALDIANGPHQKTARTVLLLNLADINANRSQYKESLQKCRLIQAFIEKNNTTDLLVQLYGVMSRNFENLGQPDSALLYLKKKILEEMKIGSKEALKANISAYLKLQTDQEQKLLEASKKQAETLAAEAKSKATLTMFFSGIIILILMAAVLLNNYFYRQKRHLVSELERVNNSLQIKHDTLRINNQQLSRYNSVISHDVLSNLDLILSHGNLINAADSDAEHLQHYFNLSQKTSRNLKKYCIDLLQYSKNSPPVSTSLIDPMPVVAEVLKQFEWALQEKGVSVDLQQLPPSPVMEVHVTQIFYNLILNMLRYASNQNLPKLFIGGSENPKGHPCWIITDNGPGIEPEKWAEILQKGETFSLQGNGIGMGHVITTLHSYGAEIHLETQPAGGTKLVLSFPPSSTSHFNR